MMDYRVKIRKLLALAESDNEFEAKSALLKAKELMADHKLTEDDLADLTKRNVKCIHTGYVYTTRGEWWMGELAVVIGENYCCQAANYKQRRRAQKREVEFIGLEEDVELCASVFDYALKTARKLAREHAKTMRDRGTSAMKLASRSYGHGFADGVKRAFEEQKSQKEEGWGLVMTIPQEVKDYCAGFRTTRRTSTKSVYSDSVTAGFTEGKRFNPTRCLR